MKLLGSTKEDVDKDKKWRKCTKIRNSWGCNLVKNDYQHTSKLLFTFVPDKKFGQLINTSPHAFAMTNTAHIYNDEHKFGSRIKLVKQPRLKIM